MYSVALQYASALCPVLVAAHITEWTKQHRRSPLPQTLCSGAEPLRTLNASQAHWQTVPWREYRFSCSPSFLPFSVSFPHSKKTLTDNTWKNKRLKATKIYLCWGILLKMDKMERKGKKTSIDLSSVLPTVFASSPVVLQHVQELGQLS